MADVMPHLPDPQSSHSPFRLAEKHFKSRLIPHTTPSLPPDILDLSRPLLQEEDEVWRAGWWGPPEDEGSVRYRRRKGKERERGTRGQDGGEGLQKVDVDGRIGYVVADGCILLPRYLDPGEQLDLLRSALTEYTLPPNPLSLSTHYDLPPDLFGTCMTNPETQVQTLFSKLPPNEQEAIRVREQQLGHRTTQDSKAGSEVGYEKILESGKQWKGDVPGSQLSEKSVEELMRELRWANLGWVYRWTTKSYDFDTPTPITFPSHLGNMCTDIIKNVPWAEVFRNESTSKNMGWENWKDDYRPDSGIVNFYQMKDTLMAHADRAELDPSRPLISISLGHAAIFLLGSTTRDTAPRPIILRSGDILIMSGPGRQGYHGVPRIMEGTLPSHLTIREEDSEVEKAVKGYIASGRVNINARQVFPPGFQRT